MSRFVNISSSHLFSAVIIIALLISVLFACEQFEPERIVKIETGSIINVGKTACTAQAKIIDTGGKNGIDQHGFCWSETRNPTTEDNKNELGSQSSKGDFSGNLTGLSTGTTYYVRAYATNDDGTVYGKELSFKTYNADDVRDYDGNYYNIVTIGNQTWLAQNLKVTHYSDGTDIHLVEEGSAWVALEGTGKAYCYPGNSPLNGKTYGAIYTWAAAMNGGGSSDANPSGVQGVCPDGWHLPSDAEWKELEMYLGMSQAEADDWGFRGTDEGSKLAGNSALWDDGELENDPSFGSSGFNALPAGGRTATGGEFVSFGVRAYLWSASEPCVDTTNTRYIYYDTTTVSRQNYLKNVGCSVRCIKD